MSENIIYYLEMHSPEQLNRVENNKGLVITETELKNFRFNRFLYQLVGRLWQWTEKLGWSDEQWRDYVENPKMRTWVAYYRGAIAGYFELLQAEQGDVEIAYFGLAEEFIGQGFGGYLLTQAIDNAWRCYPDTKRVWVHTCTLDHANALANYQARGLRIYTTAKG